MSSEASLSVRLCLGMAWLFQHTPLRRVALRTEGTSRYHSYDDYFADRTSQLADYRALFSPFCSFAGRVVAELGCNRGYLLDAFRRVEDFTAIGIDRDPVALALGRKAYGERVRFVQSTATVIPLPTASVDVVYTIDTVEHLSRPRETAAAIYASPAHVPACYWFDPETGARRPNPYLDRDHWRDYLNRMTIRRFRALLSTLPFEVVHFRALGFGGRRFSLARHLGRLCRVPGLDELFSAAVFCVLRSRAADPHGAPEAPGRRQEIGSPQCVES